MTSEDQNLSYVIAYAVVNDKQDLINFLSENAIIVKENITDEELTSLVISALASSVKVQENFLVWVEFKSKNSLFSNSTGYFSGLPTFSPTLTTTTPTPTTTTSTSSGFWSGFDAGAVTGILSSGLNLFGSLTTSKEQRKALEAQANAQIAAANAQATSDMTQLQIAQLQLQAVQAGVKPGAKSNTTLIVVGVVGGLAVLGTVIYFVTRKK